MPLLKLLHFASLLCWCGSLVYLPTMIAAGVRRQEELFFRDHAHLTRIVFTHIGTPAALIAITSGSAIFLTDGIVASWLILKLTAVVGLVSCHALCGALVFRIECAQPEITVRYQCMALAVAICLLIATVLWLVLAKPF